MPVSWQIYYRPNQAYIVAKCRECPARLLYQKQDDDYKLTSISVSHEHCPKNVRNVKKTELISDYI